ncbi:3-hydroxyacyl-CoA dehydrogenase [Vagococcus silagei]|uniref:3-hydroxyacyl-CoA dehydrogenase n=1 Tax=Vagococcus silagei TaxID=2508885 RepID=A0A4S3B6Y9_9ENTE|nr:3-hydroxyacyl-CoA dehydrogenase [Vagococcus silagei]THB62438.1 3-hydroxyacyl-CoA dehydrogenase [Vagococcus silagei]
MEFKNVTVIGSGVLGSQIAFQIAYSGFQVVVNDINDEVLEKAKERIKTLTQSYKQDLKASDAELELALNRMTYTSDLGDAVKEADIVIEAVPEVREIKINLYQRVNELAPKHTVIATNTSTFLPSDFADETGRPEQFIALHFANHIWVNNTAEIQGSAKTSPEVFDSVVAFAKEIGMVALPLHKEYPGYILNALLVPFLKAGENLMVKGIADPETVDKTWMIATKAPRGPFAILDIVGLNTAYNIALSEDTDDARATAAYLKEHYIDKGKLGVQTGEGFYKYPNPSYLEKDFLN